MVTYASQSQPIFLWRFARAFRWDLCYGGLVNDRDEYIAGPSCNWTHFWCGLIFGAIVGSLIAWQIFDSGWRVILAASVIALLIAGSCARWGDRAWRWVIESLLWFT